MIWKGTSIGRQGNRDEMEYRGRLHRLCAQVRWQHRCGEPVRSLNRAPASELTSTKGQARVIYIFTLPSSILPFSTPLSQSLTSPSLPPRLSPCSISHLPFPPSHVSFLCPFIPLVLPPQSFPTPSLPTQHLFLLSFLSPPPWAFCSKTPSQ